MAKLNHFEISRILGARVEARLGATQFGGFGLESIVADTRGQRISVDRPYANELLSSEDVQRRVVKAFEDVRDGAPTDALLFDDKLRDLFEKACVTAQIELTAAQCRKIIFRIRKASNSTFKLSKATYQVSTPQVAKDYLPVIESAVARIRYSTGQSIDEIFIRDDLRNQFAAFVATLAPKLSLEHAIQGALYLRKGVRKQVKEAIEPLKLSRLTTSLTSEPVRDSLCDNLPTEEGFFEVSAPRHSIYAGWNRSLKDVCDVFVRRETFDVITGDLWDVPHGELEFRYFAGHKLDDVETSAWAAKFVIEKQPLFNVAKAA
ncbi:hypothetical protein LF1_11470 [Rubripirellula obstinata]|uniref:Uncharacterized protein n=1 Tax=Rubripirellula obstinata TaxID=406547 RepID=A0A5B1CFE1_9BACT|nr:hypothetical protein [Rubripirellula obstinata]KAA1258625.1 hypothetical protein LF1_11470 [Rubripirellula obstinata]